MPKKNSRTIYDEPDYRYFKEFNNQLLDETSPLGKIISSESIRQSSKNIQDLITDHLVKNGHAVRRE